MFYLSRYHTVLTKIPVPVYRDSGVSNYGSGGFSNLNSGFGPVSGFFSSLNSVSGSGKISDSGRSPQAIYCRKGKIGKNWAGRILRCNL